MLVDDDRLVLATLSAGLRDAGYRVITAESAEEAQDLLTGSERPELCILDIRMGGMDGLSLARRLRELDHIPFIMFSAFSEPAMVEEANRTGALAYLVKPLDLPQLLPAVAAALSRANELQELRATREQLQAALDMDRAISVAIGLVMARDHVGRREAFERLRNLARSQRRKLVELCQELVDQAEKVRTS
ncbi:MAG: response regulator [Hylemonella sp.]|nr:response regulator [Hylemonella sp.]